LSQLSSMFLLVAHSAPSLTLRRYSVASFMLFSLSLCLSVSLWTERQAKKEELDCSGCPFPEEEVQTMKESEHQIRNLINIECCSGIQSTCTPEHGVLVRDNAVGFKEVKAADLEIGATALIFHQSEETIKAVTVEPASDRVASMEQECKNSFLFAVNQMNDEAIAAMLPMINFESVWGKDDASDDSFSSNFRLGPRLEKDLALSDVTRIPKGADGQLHSCGSRHHPHNCTPCWCAKGCGDGLLCTQCHYPHPERPKTSKKRAAHRKGNMLAPVQGTCEEPAIHVTVRTPEWALQEKDGNLSAVPSMCRTHSATSLL